MRELYSVKYLCKCYIAKCDIFYIDFKLEEYNLTMKIIILDDSQTIRMIIEAHLEELEILESEIYSFENGYDALDFIKVHGASLIFCDMHMPHMSGVEFATLLFKERPELKRNFFVITAEEKLESINEMKLIGAKRFLKKPIDEKQFNHYVKKEILRIRTEAKNYNKVIQQQFELIDKYVIMSQTNLKGIITYVSEAFCEISGYTKEELIGQPHNIIRHSDMSSEVFKDLWKTIELNQTWQGEIKNLRKDGSYYWVESTISPNIDVITGYMSVRIDISDRKKLQELLS